MILIDNLCFHYRHIVIYLTLAISVPTRSQGYRPLSRVLHPVAGHFVAELPRRIFHHHRSKQRLPRPQDGIHIEPRAFEVDTLPSTPQLNAIMDRAMGKVKSMVKELEDEKGRPEILPHHFIVTIALSENLRHDRLRI